MCFSLWVTVSRKDTCCLTAPADRPFAEKRREESWEENRKNRFPHIISFYKQTEEEIKSSCGQIDGTGASRYSPLSSVPSPNYSSIRGHISYISLKGRKADLCFSSQICASHRGANLACGLPLAVEEKRKPQQRGDPFLQQSFH